MKKNIFTKTLAVVALFFAISAQAEENYVTKYTCTSEEYSLQVLQTINPKVDIQAKIILTNKSTGEVKAYSALNPVYQKSLYLETYEYALFDGVAFPGTLKVSKQQKIGRGGGFCGRAGCDFPAPVNPVPVNSTYAALKLGEYEDSFVCNQ